VILFGSLGINDNVVTVDRTTDDGSTWQTVSINHGQPQGRIRFLVGMIDWPIFFAAMEFGGWAVPKLMRSTDAGLSWQNTPLSLPSANHVFTHMFRTNADSWLVSSLRLFANRQIYRSTDNGATWALVHNAAPGARLYFAQRRNGNPAQRIWASRFLYSDDDGQTWTSSGLPDAQFGAWSYRSAVIVGQGDGGEPVLRTADDVNWTNTGLAGDIRTFGEPLWVVTARSKIRRVRH
jgi:photosystem II stability/assembly factor-like uncharacterized protein